MFQQSAAVEADYHHLFTGKVLKHSFLTPLHRMRSETAWILNERDTLMAVRSKSGFSASKYFIKVILMTFSFFSRRQCPTSL